MTGKPSDPTALARRLSQPPPRSSSGGELPEVSAGAYDAESCGDFGIQIARDGTWFYHGSPITRKPLVRLFASVLRRDEHGEYWLQTPVEKGRIKVEDAPFVAVELVVSGKGSTQELSFRTNLDEIVVAGPDHPIRVSEESGTGEPRPYLAVRDRLEALIARPVFYQLVDLGEEHPGPPPGFGVWSRGAFFALGQTA
jgi:uncharacterized protein